MLKLATLVFTTRFAWLTPSTKLKTNGVTSLDAAPQVLAAWRAQFPPDRHLLRRRVGACSDVKHLKFALDNTLKTAFGVVGASACELDILSFDITQSNSKEPSTASLRVQRSGLETLRGAITMCTALDGKLCKLEVLHMGDSLMDMASGRFL